MAKAKVAFEKPVPELGRVLSGESLERLTDALADMGADMGIGEMARIGAAMSQIGDAFTAAAKASAEARMNRNEYLDAGVLFTRREPTTAVSLITAKVRAEMPPEEHPDLYRTTARAGSVTVKIVEKE